MSGATAESLLPGGTRRDDRRTPLTFAVLVQFPGLWLRNEQRVEEVCGEQAARRACVIAVNGLPGTAAAVGRTPAQQDAAYAVPGSAPTTWDGPVAEPFNLGARTCM